MQPERVRRDEAMPVIRDFARLIKDACQTLEVGGSVRRMAQFVKDVELVVIAGDSLRARLDTLVATGRADKALYGEARSPRWSDKYRGVEFGGLRFEIFFTDEHSWGYQYWLRTGPGDANEFVMVRMAAGNAPYRFRDGALWIDAQRRVSIPTEFELFRLLGMPYIYPVGRCVGAYRQYMRRNRWADVASLTLVDGPQDSKPRQNSLF